MSTSAYSQDTDLAKYFTDVEPLRAWFDQAIAAEEMPKRLLVIWGVGGIGKSSLLRMFRLSARSKKIPVGLASGDEAKSAVDVLARWAEDLKNDSVTLSTFFKTYDHYRAIQAKVEDQAKAANKKLGDAAVKGAGKMAEAGAAAVVGAAVGSVIPGVGTIAGAIGGMGAEALADWLRGFLSKPDIDLYTDPTKRLTDDFLVDVDKAALKQRIVLMLDTYEQMTALDDWTRELAQRLNPNVLLVIAGRAMVNWGRKWDSWLMYAQVEEVKPMTKRVMHELIRRYYKTMRPDGGEPNPKQVNDIIEFSGGLPMVVNTAVQLWVKYGVEDFGAVKGEVVREVVARLREGVPPELYPLLETAAALRYFNQDILRAVSGMGDISAGYEELLRFPFVRRRAEGYALHDRVRDMIEENVRTDDPTEYRNVHERAAVYFEARMENALGEDAERIGLERLYHRVCVDEENGIKLFQGMAEGFERYRFVSRLRQLVNNANTFQLMNDGNKLWRNYYNARLDDLDSKLSSAERIYQEISEDKARDPKLRAYALLSLGKILSRWSRLGETGMPARATRILQESLGIVPIDAFLVKGFNWLAQVQRFEGDIEDSIENTEKVFQYFRGANDPYGQLDAIGLKKIRFSGIGMWKEMLSAHQDGLKIINSMPEYSHSRVIFYRDGAWAWPFIGRPTELEKNLKNAAKIAMQNNENDSLIWIYMLLGHALSFQDRFEEGLQFFEESNIALAKRIEGSETWAAYRIGFLGLSLLRKGRTDQAKQALERSLEIREKYKIDPDFPEVLVWLGELSEIQNDTGSAAHYHNRCLEMARTKRYNFLSESAVGLVRVHHAQHDYAAIPLLLTEAEQLAQQYEYNDHLASLRLTQGHIAWDGHIPEWGKGFDAAFGYYKLALVYALRYNRFLLDEVLSGRPQGTPLRPIISECLKRGEEGRKMLLALREWWQTGLNDVGAPRPDTISPIPENISLLQAEKIAREREPGDGSTQTNVVTRIDAALAN